MRIDGTLSKWNEDRGFGFITPTRGDQDIFVHVSTFPKDGRRPTIGEPLSFEIEIDSQGRKRATSVARPGRASGGIERQRAEPVRRGPPRPVRTASSRSSLLGRIAPIVVVLALIGAYEKFFSGKASAPVAATGQVDAIATQEPAGRYSCDGRTHCSQMTSCSEAKFFLKNCPGAQMDGNNDGVPCEKQWCTGPLSR